MDLGKVESLLIKTATGTCKKSKDFSKFNTKSFQPPPKTNKIKSQKETNNLIMLDFYLIDRIKHNKSVFRHFPQRQQGYWQLSWLNVGAENNMVVTGAVVGGDPLGTGKWHTDSWLVNVYSAQGFTVFSFSHYFLQILGLFKNWRKINRKDHGLHVIFYLLIYYLVSH